MIDVMFDHQIFVTQRYGGISRYFFELARALRGVGDVRATIVAPFHVNEYLHAAHSADDTVLYFPYVKRGLRHRVPFVAPLVRAVAAWRKPDVMHETYYDADRTCASGGKVVATLHDMTFELFPAVFENAAARTASKIAALRRADHVICASDNTRRDLLAMYPEFEGRATVVYHGVAAPSGAPAPAPAPAGPYLLFVGTRGGYKNFAALFAAYAASKMLQSGFRLVLFGGGPLTPEENAMIAAAGIPAGRIEQVEGSDAHLQAAYRAATALVFPSRYEGFGMPLVEAMVNGCPVICSDASCFPEVCADAAAYFDAGDSECVRAVLEATVGAPGLLQDLVARGKRRAESFTWQRCARETAAVYRALA